MQSGCASGTRGKPIVSRGRGSRDKKAAALERARVLGMQDGKVGKPLHEREIPTWPELQTAGLTEAEAAGRMTLLHELLEAYNKAFAAAASATSAPRATAGAH